MGCKAAETTCNINNTYGSGTANECTVQRWVKKFCQGDKSLEDEECSGQPLEVDSDQLRGSSEPILLQLHEKLPKNSMSTILQSFGIWSKLERWKSSINGCLMSCPHPKYRCFEVLSSHILHNNNEPFLYWIVICEEEWILLRQPEMISSVAGSRRSSKARPKAKVHPKKGQWSRFGGLLPARFTIAFWSWQNHYIWEVCSANCWDVPETATLVAGIGQQNGPNSSLQQCLTTHPTTNATKVEWIGLRSFASSAIFTWPLANQLTLLQASQQLFAGKMPPQPAGGRKYFPRVLQIPKHRFLRYKNKQTYFLLAKMCWL